MTTASESLADRLLDAQVTWLCAQVASDDLPAMVDADLRTVLAGTTSIRIDAVLDAAHAKIVIATVLAQVPPSAGASLLVETVAGIVHSGPSSDYTPADLIDREHVEQLLDEAIASTEILEQILDDLSQHPQVASIASGFVGRIVADVVAGNRAVAEKIPGLGGLVSLGAGAAGKIVGAADKQFDAVFGETAAKGAGFVMRRFNKILVDTIREPATREAVLAVFDRYADVAVPRVADRASRDDVNRVAGIIQDVAIAGAVSDPVTALVEAVIDGFFDVYGEHTVATLIDDLGLSHDDATEALGPIVVRALRTAHETGLLAQLVRARLEPFFSSDEVRAILDGSAG